MGEVNFERSLSVETHRANCFHHSRGESPESAVRISPNRSLPAPPFTSLRGARSFRRMLSSGLLALSSFACGSSSFFAFILPRISKGADPREGAASLQQAIDFTVEDRRFATLLKQPTYRRRKLGVSRCKVASCNSISRSFPESSWLGIEHLGLILRAMVSKRDHRHDTRVWFRGRREHLM